MVKEFLTPSSIDEAIEFKNTYTGSFYFGGGTYLNYPGSFSNADCFISLEKLKLGEIKMEKKVLVVGAAVTIQNMIDSPLVPSVLKEASRFIYSRNIRNIATLGGNIGANRSDSALIPCLIALSAEVNTKEEGVLSLEEYSTGAKDSLILSVNIPPLEGDCSVKKISRSAGSACIVTAAVSLRGNGDGVSKARIAVGCAGQKVLRLASVEKGLISGELKYSDDIRQAVSESVMPETDIQGSAEYKKYITGVAVAECIAECLRRE